MAALPNPVIMVEGREDVDDFDYEPRSSDRLTHEIDRSAYLDDINSYTPEGAGGGGSHSGGFTRLGGPGGDSEELVTIAMQVELADKGSESDDDLSDIDEEEVPLWCRGCCRRCRNSRLCSMTLYLWIGIFVLTCLVALIVVGLLVVDPYRKAKRFKDTTCMPVAIERSIEEKKCSCGKGCTSGYNCIIVKVIYSNTLRDISTETIVYDNEAALKSQVSGAFLK